MLTLFAFRIRWTPFLAALCVCGLALAAVGEDAKASKAAKAETDPGAVTAEMIQARLARVPDIAGLDDAGKAELTQSYNEALNQVNVASEWAAKAAQFEATQTSAPAEIANLEAEVQQRPVVPRLDAPADATAPQLEQLLSQRDGELDAAKAEQNALNDELAHRDERRKQIPELLAAAKQHLADAQTAENEAGKEGVPPDLAEGRRTLAAAQQLAARNEIDAYEKELQVFDLTGQLLRLRVDAAGVHVGEKEKLVSVWREFVSRRRQEEAKRAVDQARAVLMEAAKASPQVREFAKTLADENASLVDRRMGPQGLLAQIDSASADEQQIDEQMNQVKSDFAGVTQKVKAAGLNNAIGHLLRRYKTALPDLGEHRQDMRERQDLIGHVQMERIELNDQRRALGDIEGVLSKYLSMANLPSEPALQTKLEGSLRGLLKAKRDNIGALLNDYDTYFDKLLETDAKERELVSQTQLFSDYIDERVLWIRSGKSFDLVDLRSLQAAGDWLASPVQWRSVLRALKSDAVTNPAYYALAGLALAALLWGYLRLIRFLPGAAERVGRRTCVTVLPTLHAFAVSIVAALPPVIVFGFLGWRLNTAGYAMDFGRMAGAALVDMAAIGFIFAAIRQLLRNKGLCESHFDWPAGPLRTIRRHVVWLTPIMMGCVVILDLLLAHGDELWIESLGRVVLLVLLCAFLLFSHVLLKPKKGAIPAIRRRLDPERKPVWDRVIYGVGIAISLLLILLTLNGFFYTALRLGARLFETGCLTVFLLIVRGVVLRWLLVARRRLAIEQARKRRELAQKSDEDTSEEELQQYEIDIAKSDAQTYRIIQSAAIVLFFVGAWFVWSSELPALRVLDRIELWHTSTTVSTSTDSGDGKGGPDTREELVPVTVADLLTAIVVAVLTLVATSNLPGFLELTVLQRLRYAKGERYAITTIVRYALAFFGTMITFSMLGIGWAKVQWLVAALGVGLGFGLQEIFANFISGLIILVERPIRIGDTVTVGGVSGTVSRIRTRATWITDANRKELIVPNKEFVTNQVTNWTLSDAIVRLVVPVGIAYGSDTALAEKLLYQVARANPDVVSDPPPVVLFNGFGDSALTFELRVFCTELDKVSHSLHRAIDQAFREAGIEMPFPQRDLHIRTAEPPLSTTEDA